MRIAIESSTWNNIGDAFYQESLKQILIKTFPEAEITTLEGPLTRAFKARFSFLSKNTFELSLHQDADFYILSGPILGDGFMQGRYPELIKKIKQQNKKYAILSVHGTSEDAINFLKENPPCAISTRNRDTYDAIQKINCPILDGVCGAFFMSKNINPCSLDADIKLITTSLYTGEEPLFTISDGDSPLYERINIEPLKKYSTPAIQKNLVPFKKKWSATVNDYQVVRMNHDIGMALPFGHFSYPNSFFSFNYMGYLSLYKGTALTITDRVHSTVATLTYGKPAIYLGKSRRDGLLISNGVAKQDGNGVYHLNQSNLDEAYERFTKWLKTNIQ